ncbi:phosphopantetheine-binding protein, partial [Mesorhizobium mediterraneum]|uniref:phosphopantetheine-binding protein n=1 Tax=Mesorhizobium mediterraneum TaxID=43617 RepID=UPI00177FBE4A
APRNSHEREIVAIWHELLGPGPIGVEDDFFELGGHSLLAMQLVTRMAHRFGAEISVRTVFEQPTVAELAIAVLAAETQQLDHAEWARLLEQVDP